ncbi:hypothetical protein CAC42_5147 [Sphaceloma murrayae]|uniref:SPT2 chromatin protein n=1 Tax=Sphaceloma murrayae TaxID=2082308 RepID=A0A2K1QU66_9PEZI|nr:hypothetical protein CAC42_5147 [Sphaceloma murrayae]
MSFLNSVLSSINKDGGAATPRPPAVPVRQQKPVQQASATAAPQDARPSGQDTLKRKAEQQGGPQALKVHKTAGTPHTGAARSNTNSPAPRLAAAPSRTREPLSESSRPSTQPSSASQKSVTSKPSVTQTPASTKPASAPKSGYLATLAKAKAAQEAAKQMGQIKHNKVEKKNLSRREKERLANEAAAAQKDPKLKERLQATGRSKDAMQPGARMSEATKKTAEGGYKGTMRPAAAAPPAYRGTMRTGGSAKPAVISQKPRQSQSSKHKYVEEYSEEDEDEEEGDYDSASSDMEAGLDDIDQEELMSAKVARKEDEEALKEEERLRKQKLERKRKLQALSAEAAKKKKVY